MLRINRVIAHATSKRLRCFVRNRCTSSTEQVDVPQSPANETPPTPSLKITANILQEEARKLDDVIYRYGFIIGGLVSMPWFVSAMQPIQGQYVIRPDPVYHTPKFQHIGYQFRPWPAIAVALGIVLQGHYCGHFIRRFWQKVDAPRLAMLATNKWWRGAFIGVAGAAVGSIPGVVYASLFTPLERYFETREEDRSIGELVRELFGAAIPALFLGAVVSAPLTVPFGSLSGAAIGYIFRKRVFAAASIVK